MEKTLSDDVYHFPGWISPGWFPHLLAETSPHLKCQLTYSKGWPGRATKDHKMGRFGDDNVGYSYRGKDKPVHPWGTELKYIRDKVIEQMKGWTPNCCVVNYYTEDGDLYPHRDSQYIPELGENPTIVSVSFGQTRDMLFYPLDEKGKRKLPHQVRLNAGDLLVMRNEADSKYHHAIRPEPDRPGIRLSLTFRKHFL